MKVTVKQFYIYRTINKYALIRILKPCTTKKTTKGEPLTLLNCGDKKRSNNE